MKKSSLWNTGSPQIMFPYTENDTKGQRAMTKNEESHPPHWVTADSCVC